MLGYENPQFQIAKWSKPLIYQVLLNRNDNCVLWLWNGWTSTKTNWTASWAFSLARIDYFASHRLHSIPYRLFLIEICRNRLYNNLLKCLVQNHFTTFSLESVQHQWQGLRKGLPVRHHGQVPGVILGGRPADAHHADSPAQGETWRLTWCSCCRHGREVPRSNPAVTNSVFTWTCLSKLLTVSVVKKRCGV